MNTRSEVHPTQEHAIACDNVTCTYPDGTVALTNVTFRIPTGKRVALIGPNGAGKSTLLRALVGVQEIEGEIHVHGWRLARKNLRSIRSCTGLVFQNPDDQLFAPTIGEDVAFGPLSLGLSKAEAHERVEEALQRVGLSASKFRNPMHLSFGERRRAAIATVLAMRPSILLLDEPSSNLDPLGRRLLINWLNELTDTTLLLASHDLDMVAECCEEVLLLNQSILMQGSARELLTDAELLARYELEPPLGLQPLSFRE